MSILRFLRLFIKSNHNPSHLILNPGALEVGPEVLLRLLSDGFGLIGHV